MRATRIGIAITIAFIWQAVRQPDALVRIPAGVLAVLCFALPMTMLSFAEFQGAIQRLMYLLVFSWLCLFCPRRTHV